MSKKIIFILLVISNLSIAEELTFANRAGANFLIGIKNGITGIANNVIDTNISKISNNMEQVEKTRQKSQLKFYKERNQLIGKFNKNLKRTIEKYKTELGDDYFQDKKDSANADLKKQLKGI